MCRGASHILHMIPQIQQLSKSQYGLRYLVQVIWIYCMSTLANFHQSTAKCRFYLTTRIFSCQSWFVSHKNIHCCFDQRVYRKLLVTMFNGPFSQQKLYCHGRTGKYVINNNNNGCIQFNLLLLSVYAELMAHRYRMTHTVKKQPSVQV